MYRNFLLIAYRNFKKQLSFTLLNMFGLALGLASAILIFLYVTDELRYDTMHPHYKDTWRIGATWHDPNGQAFDNIESPGYFLQYLKNNRSEIQKTVRIAYMGYPSSIHHKAKDKIVLTEEIRWAEPDFDQVLSFELVRGNRQAMFRDQASMVLSESGARKLFGNSNPVGEVVSVKHLWGTRNREIDVKVTGVYKDYPSNSHFKPQFIVNINALRPIYEGHFEEYLSGQRFNDNMGWFENYMVTKPGADIQQVNTVLRQLATQLSNDSMLLARNVKLSAFITPMSELHFDKKNMWEGHTKGDKAYLAIFGIIALLIILIACINYMNLATARSIKRAKEVGLRKSLGSSRGAIARQFFLESYITVCGALFMALLLGIIFIHPFNGLASKTFTVGSLFNPVMIAVVLCIVLFMGFIAGIYPALYLSRFQAVQVLKGNIVKGRAADFFRKGLVTAQYIVALVLIICTFIVTGQMDKLKTTKLNERGNQLLSIRFGGIADPGRYELFKSEVLKDHEIKYVTMGNHLPRLDYFGWVGFEVKFPDFSDKDLQWNCLNVDYDFPKTFGLELVAGRDFQNGNVNDSNALIMNEAAVKAINQPVEKLLGATVTNRFDSGRVYKVIGVMKDFPFRSMHQPIEPLMLSARPHFIDKIVYVQLPAGKFAEKMAVVEKQWRAAFPNTGFDYWFLSDEFNRMYTAEQRVSSLARAFAMLAILITVLGVFGLATYTAEQKTKEVGIRKVLGAGNKEVAALFLNSFFKIFIIACGVAIPLAWLAAYKWLEGFSYRTSISPLIFTFSIAGLFLITLLTIGYEVWKSVRINPVNSLRTE
ncbi:MAG TPA: ABC transporter permease [Ferruginibacter sp.]|nr:ABC transporter permease [Ferruginibacter sp.]HPH92545.1 ABC transporter permease [Ferruginibacter sp.]